MSFEADAIKEAAIQSMKSRLGSELGAAYGFLMFGGFGVPGLVDGATLAARGNSEAAIELTGDLAIGLVSDAAKASFAAVLEARAASVLEVAGLSAEAVATMSALVVTGLLRVDAGCTRDLATAASTTATSYPAAEHRRRWRSGRSRRRRRRPTRFRATNNPNSTPRSAAP